MRYELFNLAKLYFFELTLYMFIREIILLKMLI
mgnify:CR=1 FL=1